VAGSLIGLDKISLGNMPQLSTMILGATLVMALLFASKLLEE
jgi:hypothetical protein